jgi:hypothetical protein
VRKGNKMTDQKPASLEKAAKKPYVSPKIESIEKLESVAVACIADAQGGPPPKETGTTPGCSPQNVQS